MPTLLVVCANYRSICHITRSIDPSGPCTQDATRSEFDPVKSCPPYIWQMGIWESSLICLKRVKKRDIAVEELSVLLNVPSAWVTPAKVECVGVGGPLVMNPALPSPLTTVLLGPAYRLNVCRTRFIFQDESLLPETLWLQPNTEEAG